LRIKENESKKIKDLKKNLMHVKGMKIDPFEFSKLSFNLLAFEWEPHIWKKGLCSNPSPLLKS
jgi:hypothetical protein